MFRICPASDTPEKQKALHHINDSIDFYQPVGYGHLSKTIFLLGILNKSSYLKRLVTANGDQ